MLCGRAKRGRGYSARAFQVPLGKLTEMGVSAVRANRGRGEFGPGISRFTEKANENGGFYRFEQISGIYSVMLLFFTQIDMIWSPANFASSIQGGIQRQFM